MVVPRGSNYTQIFCKQVYLGTARNSSSFIAYKLRTGNWACDAVKTASVLSTV